MCVISLQTGNRSRYLSLKITLFGDIIFIFSKNIDMLISAKIDKITADRTQSEFAFSIQLYKRFEQNLKYNIRKEKYLRNKDFLLKIRIRRERF